MQYLRKSSALALALTLGLVAATSAQAQAFTPVNVPIVNGSLETYTGPMSLYDGGGWYGNTLAPTGWTPLNPGGWAWEDIYGQKSPDGGHYWGLQYRDGWGIENAAGISQTISGLVVGATYQLSFWSMANHTNDGRGNEHWDVTFGDQTQSGVTVDAAQPGNWKQTTLSFVATSTSQVLQFASVFVGATPGVTPEVLNLDGIKLTQVTAVPEAGTASMSLLGVGILGLLLARRKQRG